MWYVKNHWSKSCKLQGDGRFFRFAKLYHCDPIQVWINATMIEFLLHIRLPSDVINC